MSVGCHIPRLTAPDKDRPGPNRGWHSVPLHCHYSGLLDCRPFTESALPRIRKHWATYIPGLAGPVGLPASARLNSCSKSSDSGYSVVLDLLLRNRLGLVSRKKNPIRILKKFPSLDSGSSSDSCSDQVFIVNHRGNNFCGLGLWFEVGFVFGFEFERVRVWIRVRSSDQFGC